MSKEKSKSQPATNNDNIGPSSGGYFEIKLPDDWGLIRLWAEETEVKGTGGGFDHYKLRFNLDDPIEEKSLRGHQIMKNFENSNNQDIITTCTGNVTEFLTPINDPKAIDKTRPVMANINWNEYSYLPGNFLQTKTERPPPPPAQPSSSTSTSTSTSLLVQSNLTEAQRESSKRTQSELKSLPPKQSR